MDGNPLVLLLVEDNPAHAEIVKRNFKEYRIANYFFHVEDGEQALQYLFNEPPFEDKEKYPSPNLVLLDLRLPKVDGLEVLEKVKNDPRTKSIPIIVLTTSEAERDIEKAYFNSANSYLVKPVDFQKFTELMDNLGYYWMAWNKYPY